MHKVAVPAAEDMIKTIRMLALTGRRAFLTYLVQPLKENGWQRTEAQDTTKRMMQRIDAASQEPGSIHTIAPLCKRLISQSLYETLSALGDSSIYFLTQMMQHVRVSTAPEAVEFVSLLDPGMMKFRDLYQAQSAELFSAGLEAMSAEDFKKALAPVDLGKSQIKVELRQEAALLLNKIQIANRNDDIAKCRKLIAHYMVQHAESEDNNMSTVQDLVDAFEKRFQGFRSELEDFIAISLHYQIVTAVTQGDLKRAIAGIRKYAHIFQGNPAVRYHLEVDKMEARLYEIITKKGLWEELKRGS